MLEAFNGLHGLQYFLSFASENEYTRIAGVSSQSPVKSITG
jgi:hypothetical protein